MVRRAGIELGDTVLVLGGGPIGFLVASVARAAGAGRVLVSEVSQPRLALARKGGIETIDAVQADPIAVIRDRQSRKLPIRATVEKLKAQLDASHGCLWSHHYTERGAGPNRGAGPSRVRSLAYSSRATADWGQRCMTPGVHSASTAGLPTMSSHINQSTA